VVWVTVRDGEINTPLPYPSGKRFQIFERSQDLSAVAAQERVNGVANCHPVSGVDHRHESTQSTGVGHIQGITERLEVCQDGIPWACVNAGKQPCGALNVILRGGRGIGPPTWDVGEHGDWTIWARENVSAVVRREWGDDAGNSAQTRYGSELRLKF